MLQVIISSKEVISPRVCQLTLSASNGQALPAWTPGAHIDMFLPGDMIRQYSLCGSLSSDHYQIAVQLEENGKGGSRYIHESLQSGTEITISEPRNHFPLTDGHSACMFLAAGIGITPFIPMIEHCLANNRPFSLHYAVADMADSLLSNADTELDSVHIHDKTTTGVRLDIPSVLATASANADIFICGPAGFINDVLSLAEQQGIDSDHLHREFFSAEPIDHSHDGSFEVEIASSGQVISVGKDESMLEALEDNGFFVPVSCEEGVCGTCVTRLLEGEADHKDVFLTDKEKAQMDRVAVCCSRAKSARLILDL